MELSTIGGQIMTQVGKCKSTVIRDVDEYLKEAKNRIYKEKFYHELSIDTFDVHQNIVKNSLNDIFGKNLIDKETSEILNPINIKRVCFYLLPKIHNKNKSRRLEISSVNCYN